MRVYHLLRDTLDNCCLAILIILSDASLQNSLPSSLILDSNAVGENSFAYDTFHPKYDVALDLGNKIDEHQTDCTTQFPNCSCSIYSTDFWS